ncbi:MAG: SusC/RagA family TonB-linked outer membrane protein [Bacteroidales bacterium]|nr:SusC/RagA family TonB-linked outer membrane protein [Bacteroidales bacterium]
MLRIMKAHPYRLLLALLIISVFTEGIAQQRKAITGYVYSAADNLPMQGIMVSTKYRMVKSATTNESGFFRLTLSDTVRVKSVMLTFSYPGYQAREQYGNFTDTMWVYLTKSDDYSIDREVYYPYANQKYSNMTGAVEQVDFAYSTQVMSSSFHQLLENSSARVTSSSGLPGDGYAINFRGYSTIFADEKPLIVLDGQILGNYRFAETTTEGFYQDPLVNIDPRNIESISLLKDASATAIYGAKASNGVILIKTKSAKVGKTEFDITGHYGYNYMNKRIPVITNSEYFKPYLLEQMYGNGQLIFDDYFIEDPTYNQYYKYNNTTDWQDYIFDFGRSAGANINVRGGDAIAKYFFSGGYLREEGSVRNTDYNRFNIRFNADIDIAEWLVAQANMGVTYSNGNLKQQGLSYANPVLNSLIKAPFLDPFIIDSTDTRLPLTEDSDVLGISNPYEVINNSEATLSSYNFFGTINFKFKISSSLEANVRGSSELNKINEYDFLPNHGFYNNEYPHYNQIMKGISNFTRTSAEFNLRYNNVFKEVHHLSGIAGTRLNLDQIIQDIGTGVGTPSDEFKDLGTAREEGRTKSGYQFLRNEITGFLGLSYNFREVYFADITLAADASSNIGTETEPQILGVPVALSPAVGLGWDLSRLAGFNYQTVINYLKLRISAGQMCNVVYDPYISHNFYTPVQYYTATGYAKLKVQNEELRWERTNKLNFGVDLSLLKQRLYLSADVYYHQAPGLLNNTSTETELGNQYWSNNGDLNTLGSDVRLRYRIIDRENLRWSTEISVAQYSTMAANLDSDLIFDFGDGQKIFRNNKPAGAFYGYEVLGVIPSEAEANALDLYHANGTQFKAGDIHFHDINGDKIIDDADKMVIGNPAPDVYGSLVNIVSYRNYSLLADLSFTAGGEVYNHTRRILESMSGFENQSTATLRRWQVDGQETDIPTAAWGDPMGNSRFSDRWIEDGSYVRLKRLTFTVNLSPWLKSLNNPEFYVTGINLLTFTRYLGYDPEFAYNSSILWEGIDYLLFPQNRTVILGVKIGL